MLKSYRVVCALAALCMAGAWAAPKMPEHPLLTPEREARLEKGEVVVVKAKERAGEHAGASAAVLGVINKPAIAVYDTLCEFEKQSEYMPRVVKVTRYETDPPGFGLQQQIKVMWKTITYHLRANVDPDKLTMSWTLDTSRENGIKSTDGKWTFLPWGEDKCIALYELDVDTGMAVPKFVANMLLDSDLPGVLDALKKRAESDGKWKKD